MTRKEFWELVKKTKFHGAMCPCEDCERVKYAVLDNVSKAEEEKTGPLAQAIDFIYGDDCE